MRGRDNDVSVHVSSRDCLVVAKFDGSLTYNVSHRSTGGTESTVMSYESLSMPHDSPQLSSREDRSFLTGEHFSIDSDFSIKEKGTTIRLVSNNEWRLSMQIRLEMLHSGKGKRWSKKVRKRLPNPFFEISVLKSNDTATTAG